MKAVNREQASPRRERSEPHTLRVTREALQFQRREWQLQRVGWSLLTIVLLAALLGLFGNGPLAGRTLANEHAAFDFQLFARRHAATEWDIRPGRSPAGGILLVTVDAEFARHFRITGIQPEPAATRLERGLLVYEFDARAAAPLVFHLEPQEMGWHRGIVRVGDGPPFQISQLVYP